MGKKFKNFIKARGFEFAIYAVLIILISNSLLIIWYRTVLQKNQELKTDIIEMNNRQSVFDALINRGDMGLRGYMLVPDIAMLGPTISSLENFEANNAGLAKVMSKYGYDASKLQRPFKVYGEYMGLLENMSELVKAGKTDEALEILKTDPGYKAWEVYYPMLQSVTQFIADLEVKAENEHAMIMRNTRLSQIILLVVVIPFLIVVARRMRKNQLNRMELFKSLEKSREKYLFNNREDNVTIEKSQLINEEQTINDIVFNLQKAKNFIGKITEGNYATEWDGLNEKNWELNEENLAGELIKMRDQMNKMKKADEIRLWQTEGLSKFADIIRNNQSNIAELSDKVISGLVNYLDAKQGGVFILNDQNADDKFLELSGCYAYERKKFINKKLKIGDGLVGQCFLEKEYVYLKNIPEDYVQITSGLGETKPNSLILIPLKFEDSVIGVIELASLNEFKEHEINFLNQLGETIASAILTTKNNQNTKELLEKSQQQAEEMKAQEEEMRQNMEEIEATQEEMSRKEKEISRLLDEAKKRENELTGKVNEIEQMQSNLEFENSMFTTLMNLIPDRITIKDKLGVYLRVNKTKANSLKVLGISEYMGKSDMDFFGEEHFNRSYKLEKELMDNDKDYFNKDEKVKMPDGSEMWASTTWTIFKSKVGDILGTIVYTKDLTKEKNCLENLEIQKIENDKLVSEINSLKKNT